MQQPSQPQPTASKSTPPPPPTPTTVISRPPTTSTVLSATNLRPVFTNSRQKPLPIGAGTIRGALPMVMSTTATMLAPAASASSFAQPPTVIAASQPTLSMSQIVDDHPDTILSSPSLPNLKRPAEVYNIPINKQKKMAWVESQVKKDQHEAVNPNYRTPFKSKEDTCKRLLRYHVFDELNTSPWELQSADETFELKSSILITRFVILFSQLNISIGILL